MTPADDQYVYGKQALNWNQNTLTFGGDTSGDYEDTLGEYNFGEDIFDEHAFDEHMSDDTPTLIN